MKLDYVLLISLLIVGMLFIPAVSAEKITLADDTYQEFDSKHVTVSTGSTSVNSNSMDIDGIIITQPVSSPLTVQIFGTVPANVITNYASLPQSANAVFDVYKSNKLGSLLTYYGQCEYGYYKSTINGVNYLNLWYEPLPECNHNNVTGTTIPNIYKSIESVYIPRVTSTIKTAGSGEPTLPFTSDKTGYLATFGGHYSYSSSSHYVGSVAMGNVNIYMLGNWENRVVVEEARSAGLNRTDITLYRNGNISDFIVTYKDGHSSSIAGAGDEVFTVSEQNYPITYALRGFGKWYNVTFFAESPGGPTDPGETPTLRKGAVTMTDNNGTTITGFEVTAVNAYTGQSYNVSTDTDIAVMTLPMDRTIRLRNPQTGVYEEAPVGYYKFYGYKTGYKMLNEDGIRISVMPEKYGTYKLCDIGVTSESGYLTGQHKFLIRSRADNSVLQTGTISAKSATTNQWYNATVTGGIATIVLPYDTSNSISQYAGNYYVYATSPGYEDSEYATQIVVMPHTVSEIHAIYLTPIGGVPTAGNVTLRIQTFSETGPGVVNAEIFIAGVLGAGSDVWNTYIASSTGYLAVSVPGNSTYDIVASGAGYYDSARRVEVFTDDPPLIEIKLYLSGPPTLEPTTQPTGWPTDHPTTQPPGGIPDEDDDSDGFLVQAVRGIGLAFGVGFATAKLIFGMLLALSIGYTTAKKLRGGAAEFGLGLLGGTLLGVLIGLLPVWIIVVLLLVVGLYIGNRYVGGANNG